MAVRNSFDACRAGRWAAGFKWESWSPPSFLFTLATARLLSLLHDWVEGYRESDCVHMCRFYNGSFLTEWKMLGNLCGRLKSWLATILSTDRCHPVQNTGLYWARLSRIGLVLNSLPMHELNCQGAQAPNNSFMDAAPAKKQLINIGSIFNFFPRSSSSPSSQSNHYSVIQHWSMKSET